VVVVVGMAGVVAEAGSGIVAVVTVVGTAGIAAVMTGSEIAVAVAGMTGIDVVPFVAAHAGYGMAGAAEGIAGSPAECNFAEGLVAHLGPCQHKSHSRSFSNGVRCVKMIVSGA